MNSPAPLASAPALTGDFFQLGYVTRDLERAITLYRARYGVAEFLRFDTRALAPPGASGPHIQVALAYRGPVMIELIRPEPDDPGIYRDALRADGGVNLHHLGYLVDESRFETLADEFRAAGIAVPVQSRSPMGLSLLYADTRPDNGLFSEFVVLGDGGRRFFDAVPRT
jgi:hypothetical protein